MPQFKIQPSFNSGEWAPQLYARVDLEKYRSAAALLRNFFVDYRGGASTRPGTKYCLQAYKSATAVRLIPFQGSFTVGYMLEFGDKYIRFYYQGAPVLETGLNITGASQTNPCVLTVANSYTTGDVDWIYVSGVAGMTQLNGRYFKVHARNATTVTLYDLFGNPVDATGYTAWSSGGTTQRVYTVASPYAAADLALVKFAQNVNQLILCHPSYAPQVLSIVTATNWTIAPITFGTTVTAPTGLGASSTTSGTGFWWSYLVTAVDSFGQESAATSFVAINNVGNIGAGGTNTITWSAVSGAASYNVYRASFNIGAPVPAGVPYGFIGNVSGLIIADSNITADFSLGPPVARNPFAAGVNPAVPAFFQQRLVLAAPATATQTLYFSQPGAFYNYDVSFPVNSGDAITAQLVSGSLSNIKNMVAQPSGLIVLSDGGSFLINGGSAGSAISPSEIVANAQSFDGSSDLPPIVANYDILFVTSKGSSVRDSTYNFYANVFTGVDISVLASHLFFGYTLTEWCWAQEPFKVVWAVRNDGTMLTLTFIKDQEFIGWAHSDTAGSFKSVATIVESTSSGNMNAVYTAVQRTVGGQSLQYVERFAERYWTAADECWCVDSGLSYSGSPATSFTGGEHLAGLTVTGLADGSVITPFVMPASGAFTLSPAASEVVIGLGYTAQLQTMAIDEGSAGVPTIQGRPKKIAAVDVRVADTLGLKIGGSFSASSLVIMKDLVVGNVGSMLIGQDTQLVTGLFTGDARTYVDPRWTVYGQFCIQQDQPLPATILGVLPIFEAGDTRK